MLTRNEQAHIYRRAANVAAANALRWKGVADKLKNTGFDAAYQAAAKRYRYYMRKQSEAISLSITYW